MAYHTLPYLFGFLPAALLAYQLTPGKYRWVTLLAAGYIFFYLISGKLVLWLIGATVFTHYMGIWISAEETKKKLVFFLGIGGLLAALGYLKYYNFFAENLNGLGEVFGTGLQLPMKNLILPIGISFYTLQAVGYLADVYWEKIPPEKHLGKLALFLSFFPQLMEGPISMYGQTAESLWKGEGLRLENLSGGCVRIFWGLFKKMIIADRLSVIVRQIFDHYQDYQGAMIALGAVAYTVQLYMEFSGCMDMVIGSGRMFGVVLPENFRQPFASRGAAEFWRRWHITLGTWLKNYVFYPVSLSRPVKKWNRFGRKHLGKYGTKLGASAIALFPVWLCNGLWHGPRWSFLFYGMYYYVILILGIASEPLGKKFRELLHIGENSWYWRGFQVGRTWIIIFTGELFFRAESLKTGFEMFFSMFHNFTLEIFRDGTIWKLGLDRADYFAVLAGAAAVGAVGILRERNPEGTVDPGRLCLPLRWTLYYALILSVVIFGAYGTGYQPVDLIYAGF